MPYTGWDYKMTTCDLVGLLTIRRVCLVAKPSGRYYRRVAQAVLRWYTELEDGIIQSDNGPVFDSRVLDYRIDVDAVLKRFDAREVQAILLIHRDGLSQAQAVQLAGIVAARPDALVEDIEIRMGQAFERRGLEEFLRYVDFLR